VQQWPNGLSSGLAEDTCGPEEHSIKVFDPLTAGAIISSGQADANLSDDQHLVMALLMV